MVDWTTSCGRGPHNGQRLVTSMLFVPREYSSVKIVPVAWVSSFWKDTYYWTTKNITGLEDLPHPHLCSKFPDLKHVSLVNSFNHIGDVPIGLSVVDSFLPPCSCLKIRQKHSSRFYRSCCGLHAHTQIIFIQVTMFL